MHFGKRRLGRAGAAALVISLTAVTPVRAADLTVSNLNDSGPGKDKVQQ